MPLPFLAMEGYHSVTRQQQRTRSQGSILREVQLDESNGGTVVKTVGPGGRDGISDRPLRRSHRVDHESTARGPTRTRIPRGSVNGRGETRVQMQTIIDDVIKVIDQFDYPTVTSSFLVSYI